MRCLIAIWALAIFLFLVAGCSRADWLYFTHVTLGGAKGVLVSPQPEWVWSCGPLPGTQSVTFCQEVAP